MRSFVICLVLVTIGCTASPEQQSGGAPPPSATQTQTPPGTQQPSGEITETQPVPPSTQTTAPVPPVTSTAAQTPPARPQREITIDGVENANPLVVTGLARTFENNVVIRVRDARGALITETFTTSNGEMGHHNPYRATVWLTRHPGSSVTVEALEYSAKDGSDRSLVSRRMPFNIAPVTVELALPSDPQRDCTKTRIVKRELPKTVSMVRVLVEALIAEPSPFPKGSRVESVNLRGGVVTVDFNERLRNVGGSCAAQAIRASVTGTLSRLPNVREVVITAAGNRDQALQP
ncbi:MAG TPA: Gmad2 immunoglobulin-like domain-containing protein [Thermoanaerobaculia bacterium]